MFGAAINRVERLARLRALRRLYDSFGSTAETRAKRLLREWLSPEQREQFDTEGHFDVTGSKTGKRYRINYGSCANVRELDINGKLVMGLCFVPAGQLAAGDVMLAQKIALETNEIQVLRSANRFLPCLLPNVRPPPRRPF